MSWGVGLLTSQRMRSALVSGQDPESGPLTLRSPNPVLPTTPNPTSGFYLLIPAGDLRKVDMTSEEAFKLIMSAGIVTPGRVRIANSWVGYTNPGVLPSGD